MHDLLARSLARTRDRCCLRLRRRNRDLEEFFIVAFMIDDRRARAGTRLGLMFHRYCRIASEMVATR